MLTTALASAPACKSCSGGEEGGSYAAVGDGPACPSHRRHHQRVEKSAVAQMAAAGATYVYPKLQLVQIDDAWYALNQTCLQIYQQLQMCGTAQLMPVDVVPLNKLPDCVRKSLSSSGNESTDEQKLGQNHKRDEDEHRNRRTSDQVDAFRVYDVMSDSVNGSRKPANHESSHNGSDEKSWWSRLFPYCSSSLSQGAHRPDAVDNQRRYAMRQVHRRQHQIVQKLMEETSLISTGDDQKATQPTADPSSSDGSCVCVICQSTFATHRLLQRHRERVNHFGCSICFKSFKSCSSLQDHCDLLSHWSEGDSDDDDSVDLDSEDEYFFSSETSDDD